MFAAMMPDGFSARFDALARVYVYRILSRPQPSAVAARFAHDLWQPIDVDVLRRAATDLIGQHDFAAFCGERPDRGGTVGRTMRLMRDERRILVLRVAHRQLAFARMVRKGWVR